MGNKTFVLNSVVVDTLTALHISGWCNNNNNSISDSGTYACYNTLYEKQQLLSAKFSTIENTYLVYVVADFGDETKPKGLGAEGVSNIIGLAGQSPGKWIGAGAHALGLRIPRH